MAKEVVTLTPPANDTERSPALQRVADAQAQIAQLQKQLDKAMDVRTAAVLKALDRNESQSQIAKVLGVSHTAVQKIAQRGQS